jgi:hypothetical protein
MELIVYDSIEKKNEIEAAMAVQLSPKERLLLMLDWMDFLASMRKSPRNYQEDEGIDWIILKFRDDKQSY